MVEIKNNFPDFADKLKIRSDLEPFTPPHPAGVKRRMISPGVGGRPRKFAGVITGHSPSGQVSSDDFSGAIDMGDPLPSPEEMARREDAAAKPLKTKNKIPLPPPKNRRDGRPDTPPKRPGPIGK